MSSRRQFLQAMGVAGSGVLLGRWPAWAGGPGVRYITIMGATSCISYVKAVLPEWERAHRGVKVAVTGGGSYAGLHALALAQAEIAMADLAPPTSMAVPVRRYLLGRLPIVLAAWPHIGVGRLSWGQAGAVLAGDIVNWRQVGGADVPVVTISRPESSGAREVVQQRILGTRRFSPDSIIQLSNGAVLRTVMETPGAVGYLEATAPMHRVRILGMGSRSFSPQAWRLWPLYAEPSLYVRVQAPEEVRNLAVFLQGRPERQDFGIYFDQRPGQADAR